MTLATIKNAVREYIDKDVMRTVKSGEACNHPDHGANLQVMFKVFLFKKTLERGFTLMAGDVV